MEKRRNGKGRRGEVAVSGPSRKALPSRLWASWVNECRGDGTEEEVGVSVTLDTTCAATRNSPSVKATPGPPGPKSAHWREKNDPPLQNEH